MNHSESDTAATPKILSAVALSPGQGRPAQVQQDEVRRSALRDSCKLGKLTTIRELCRMERTMMTMKKMSRPPLPMDSRIFPERFSSCRHCEHPCVKWQGH